MPAEPGLGLFESVFDLGGQLRLAPHFEVVLRLFRFQNQDMQARWSGSSPIELIAFASSG